MDAASLKDPSSSLDSTLPFPVIFIWSIFINKWECGDISWPLGKERKTLLRQSLNCNLARQRPIAQGCVCIQDKSTTFPEKKLDLIQFQVQVYKTAYDFAILWWHCSNYHVSGLCIAFTTTPYVQFKSSADWKYKVEEVWLSPDLGSFFLCFGILRLFWIVEYYNSTKMLDWIVISQHCISLEICYCAQFPLHSSPVSLISSPLFTVEATENTFTFTFASDTSQPI